MKKSRFTEEKMVAILREADRTSVPEVSKKYKVGEQSIYVWRRKSGAMEPADVKRLRALETENSKLKIRATHAPGDEHDHHYQIQQPLRARAFRRPLSQTMVYSEYILIFYLGSTETIQLDIEHREAPRDCPCA
jgi:putative transposase